MSRETNAILAKQKYGVSPSIIHYIAMNTFHITDLEGTTPGKPIISYRDCFSEYFLLYWNSEYFISEMKEGCIIKNDIPYHVIFKHDLSRGKLIFQNRNKQVIQLALSFRQAQPEFNIPAYVLVDGRTK